MDALIVAGTVKQQHALSDVLNQAKFDCVVATTAAEARRSVLCRMFDIFVINAGLPDELGNELAIDLARSGDIGGLYIDDYTRSDLFSDDLGSVGVLTLARPITRSGLCEAVRMISIANVRVRSLKEKNEELCSKLEDMKYISRAKIALMRSLGYTEDQSHKYIEKRAMEMRMTRRKVAMDIIKTYEGI